MESARWRIKISQTGTEKATQWKKLATEFCKKIPVESLQRLYREAVNKRHTVGKAFIIEYAQQLDIHLNQNTKSLKIVFFGKADNGKTTILKQLRMLNGNGISERENQWYHNKLVWGVIQGVVNFFNIMSKTTEFSDTVKKLAAQIEVYDDVPPSSETKKLACQLWLDRQVQAALQPVNLLTILSPFHVYCISEMYRLLDSQHPNVTDILKTHIPSYGISELNMAVSNVGCKAIFCCVSEEERTRWAKYLTDINVLVFTLSLLTFIEKPSCNPLAHYKSLCDSYPNIPKHLFLTKRDLFEAHLLESPNTFHRQYPEYSGTTQIEDICNYITSKFEEISKPQQIFFINLLDQVHVSQIISSLVSGVPLQ